MAFLFTVGTHGSTFTLTHLEDASTPDFKILQRKAVSSKAVLTEMSTILPEEPTQKLTTVVTVADDIPNTLTFNHDQNATFLTVFVNSHEEYYKIVPFATALYNQYKSKLRGPQVAMPINTLSPINLRVPMPVRRYSLSKALESSSRHVGHQLERWH